MSRNTHGIAGLFIPGPTNVPERVRQALNVPMQDMRAPDFGELTLPILADLKKILRTQTGTAFMYPGSGTGGWEACIANLFSANDKVLMSSFGQFSTLWVDMARRWGLDVECFDVEWGQGTPIEEYRRVLEADKEHKIKGVFACHNETATGVVSDIKAIGEILRDLNHPALFCVDSVSGLGSIPLEMDAWNIDVIVAGSQKGLMLPTGLGIVGVSERALERRTTADLPRTFFSFDDMIKNNATGHFPYTPATTLFHGLRASLDMIAEEGLENVWARHRHLATGIRAAVIDGWGLKTCCEDPAWASDTVTAVVVPEYNDARDVLTSAYQNYNTAFGSGLARLAGKVFRIGHLGSFNEIMALQAVACAEMAMVDAGIDIQLGSGVAAAQRCYIQNRAAELKIAA